MVKLASVKQWLQEPRARHVLRSTLQDRLWIMREAVGMRPALAAAALGMVLLSAALPLASMVATGLVVGSVPGTVQDGLLSPAGRRALEGLAFLTATLVAGRLVAPVRSTIGTALKLDVDARMEQRAMRAVAAPPEAPWAIAHLEDPATLDRISMVQGIGTTQYTPGEVVAALIEKAPLWLQGLGSAAIVARFQWWLAPVLLVAWLWATDTGRRQLMNTAAAAARTTRAVRRSGYLRDLALQPAAAREIRVYGLASWLIERFSSEWLRAMAPIWQERWQGNRALVVSALPAVLAQSFAYALVGWAGAQGEVGLGALALYLSAIDGIGMSFGSRSAADFRLAYGTAAVPAVRELDTALVPAQSSPAALDTDAPVAALPARLTKGIRLEGVSFHYPGREEAVLSDLNLFIPAGRSLAIVGANGAGKTTLIKLLCRLYDPSLPPDSAQPPGRITADDVDLRTVDPRVWRSHVSAIFQDFVQYPLSARDNIAFGAIAAAGDDDRVAEAARRAGADEIIKELPRGWDTVLSRRFAGGVDLSGGQWQRIALARALFGAQAGADVLILDEPTAHLDVRAEAELYDRFLEITTGLTTILISHRFSTVRRADRICVLEGSRIVEEGTHDELVAADGRYAHMFALQASRFVEEAAARPAGGDGDA